MPADLPLAAVDVDVDVIRWKSFQLPMKLPVVCPITHDVHLPSCKSL